MPWTKSKCANVVIDNITDKCPFPVETQALHPSGKLLLTALVEAWRFFRYISISHEYDRSRKRVSILIARKFYWIFDGAVIQIRFNKAKNEQLARLIHSRLLDRG
uniref:AlNc14C228G9241 protein n=1 Tax=Albugo laibachii Nc14 TaxID=890382 RepID=F0WSA2_9STRA|nr:AlNc14C228G9241 [Albugo laibachii Nc14]|eukprot:CCA24221.1 AlNc14C228G9241 [Albugo laibachii Nc14]